MVFWREGDLQILLANVSSNSERELVELKEHVKQSVGHGCFEYPEQFQRVVNLVKHLRSTK